MKKLMLTLLTIFAFSFSFAQSNTAKEHAMELKKNTAEVIEYLSIELKLESDQKAIFSNAFAEYSSNISRLNEKLNARSSKMTNKEKTEITAKKMADFTKIRDTKIMGILTENQLKIYKNLSRTFDPMTLTMKKKK